MLLLLGVWIATLQRSKSLIVNILPKVCPLPVLWLTLGRDISFGRKAVYAAICIGLQRTLSLVSEIERSVFNHLELHKRNSASCFFVSALSLGLGFIRKTFSNSCLASAL